jgi:uroporphyrinogen-III synthase
MIVFTRPDAYQSEVAELAAAVPHKVVPSPVLKFQPLGKGILSVAGFDALIFTSRLAVRACAGRISNRALMCFAVGPGTAEELTRSGFSHVIAAQGDVGALLAILKVTPFRRALYVSGAEVTVDLSDRDPRRIERRVVYDMVPSDGLADQVRSILASGEAVITPLYSARSCRIFERHLREAGLEKVSSHSTAVFISEKVRTASTLPWGRAVVATTPDRSGMINAIRQAA